jgi:hypothetical protein
LIKTRVDRFLSSPQRVDVRMAPFQVVSRAGGQNRLFPWEAGWKDTVLQENREIIEVLIRSTNTAASSCCTATNSNTKT